jgi:putative sigma-54 modulation protein
MKGGLFMEIKIYGKNIDITKGLESAVHEDFKKLEKYIRNKYGENVVDSTIANVTLEVKKNRQKAEISASINGQLFRAEEATDDMYISVKTCAKKLEQQLIKYDKSLISKHQKRKNHSVENETVSVIEEEIAIAEEIKISRTKHLKLIPMSVEDAIEQMNATGHDFYLFLNKVTEEVNLVYRRLDDEDDYGVITTEK